MIAAGKRGSSSDPIVVVVEAVPPRAEFPNIILQGQCVLVLNTVKMLGYSALSALEEVVSELRTWCQYKGSQPDLVVVPASLLLSTEPTNEPSEAPVTVELIGMLSEVCPKIMLLAGNHHLPRLSELPHSVFRLSSPPMPTFLRRIRAGEQVFAGCTDALDRLAAIVKGGHCMIIGPPGVGKTVLARNLNTHPDFQDRLLVEVNLRELMAGTNWRGQLERKIKSLFDYLEAVPGSVCLLDEALSFMQRTGDSEHMASDSIIDLLKPELAREGTQFRIMTTLTDTEGEYLHRMDSAAWRRFTPLHLAAPGEEDIDRIVLAWCEEWETRKDPDFIAELREAARYVPAEASPSREIKLLRQLRERGTGVEPLDIVRETYPLAAPRLDLLRASMQGAEEELLGRSAELSEFGNALEQAVKASVVLEPGESAPLLVALLWGPKGTGKSHFARSLARQLCPEFSEIHLPDLFDFVRTNRTIPGRAVVVRGNSVLLQGDRVPDEAGESQPERYPALSGIEMLRPLNRWLLLFCIDVDGIAPASQPTQLLDGPMPVLMMDMRAPVLKPAERERLAGRLLERLRVRAANANPGLSIDTPKTLVRSIAEQCRTPHEIESAIASTLLGLRAVPRPQAATASTATTNVVSFRTLMDGTSRKGRPDNR